MKTFSWLDVTADRCCPRCLAVMEEENKLTREVHYLRGDEASVRWSCEKCKFVQVGSFNFEGTEVSDLIDNHIMDGIREAKAAERRRLAAPEPIRLKPKPRVLPSFAESPKEYKTDEEALADTFPDAVSQDDLLRTIEAVFPESLESEGRRVDRTLAPVKVTMGQRGLMEGYAVSYLLEGVEVFSITYFSADGIPQDIETDAKKAGIALQSLVRRRTSLPQPRQPTGFQRRAVHIPDMDSGEPVEVVKSRGMPATGEGVRG